MHGHTNHTQKQDVIYHMHENSILNGCEYNLSAARATEEGNQMCLKALKTKGRFDFI